jgi:hypothetical protein
MNTKDIPSLSNTVITPKVATVFEASKLLKVSFKNSKSKIEIKPKGHKEGRMKVTLKFGKDEAEGFSNFCKMAKPQNMSQDDFVKFLFYKGVQALQEDFAQKIEEFKEKDPEGFAKMKAELEAQEQSSEGTVTVASEPENGNS